MVIDAANEQKQSDITPENVTPDIAYRILSFNRKLSVFVQHLQSFRPGTTYNTVHATFRRYKETDTDLRQFIKSQAVKFVEDHELRMGL